MGEQNKDHYAIAIGIDGYSQLRPLTAAVRDATIFTQWLLAEDGGNLPTNNVRIIPSPPNLPADPQDARPIQREIDRALRDFGVANGQRVGKRLYFYFAGHGYGSAFDDVGMLMADAAMGWLRSNVGLRPYRKFFHDFAPFDEVVYFIDCCRDSTLFDETAKPGFTLTRQPGFNRRVNDFVVLAADYGEKAFQPVSKETGERRGLLTQAILEALKGAPEALDPKQRVTSATLRQYIGKRVVELADEEKLRQRPDVLQLPDPELIFYEVAPANIKTFVLRIVAPDGMTGDLVLRHGSDRSEIGRRPASMAPADGPDVWQIRLAAASRYEIEHTQSDLDLVVDPAKATGDPYVYRVPRPV